MATKKEKTSYRGVNKITRANGTVTYETSYYVTCPDGNKKRVYKSGFNTAKEANTFRNEMLIKDDKGEYIDNSKITIEGYIQIWLPSNKNILSPNSYIYYESISKNHIIPHLGKRKLQSIKAMDIKTFMNNYEAPNATIRHIHKFLNKMFNSAVNYEYLLKNPMTNKIQCPKKEHREIRVLDEQQLKNLLEVINEKSIYVPTYIAAYTGMRLSEILGLTWDNVDFKTGYITILKQLQFVDNDYVLSELKTPSSKRRIKMSSTLIDFLKKVKKQQMENRLLLGSNYYNKYDLVACKNDGTPFKRPRFSSYFIDVIKKFKYKDGKTIAEYLQIPNISFHDLRHTFATLMLKANVNPKIVADMLGHASIKITLDTYSHLLPSMQEEAIDKLDSMLK